MKTSRTSSVTKRIRADIIAGQLGSGTRLTETLLATRYDVSRMPVREALRALAAEGLVESRPYAGVTVAAVPDEDAADLFAIRIELEGATARRAAEHAGKLAAPGASDAKWAQLRLDLDEVLTAGDKALAEGDLVALATLNMQFHQLVAELSGSASLASLLDQISGRLEWLYSKNITRRGGQAWTEHHAVVQAIDDGDATLASRLMSGHVRRSMDSYFLLIQDAKKEAAQGRA